MYDFEIRHCSYKKADTRVFIEIPEHTFTWAALLIPFCRASRHLHARTLSCQLPRESRPVSYTHRTSFLTYTCHL